ncbi:MAG: ATP-binding cassette domain-containing protein [Actinobacteria bacterium]|uniref:Unannotated protein n=1 Tax=freshwater metagenome TaxID=449393 RepID=A0A6J6T592_9ZZZZ|nr:ATP-binding cassette domain-containing protein [Actinomycetota bacterium]MSX25048.1 ATP-binding cassette domain-containing protein [Actinomycetota bacterium]MSY56881.1 ATP-binding cassette domain-containing protein [Actinomycetota bacterium]MTA99835.1 ATP-binding cassette domain-containing protein [Actinomycetota bacterium]
MKSADLRLLLSRSGSRRLFLSALLAACVWSAIVIANAYLIAEIIIGIISHSHGVSARIILLGSLWIFRAFFNSRFEYWTASQALAIKVQLRAETTRRVSNYGKVSPAELVTVLTKGLNALDIYLGRFIPQMAFAGIVPFAIMAAIFVNDYLSAIIAIATLPLIPVFGALIGKYSADEVSRKWQSLGTLSRYFEDSLRGFTTLKIFGRSASQSERIGAMGKKYTDETMKVLRISFLSAFALELVATISVAVVAVSVGLRLVAGTMEFKPAMIVLILAPEVYFPVRNAASLFHASEDGTQSLRELSRIQGDDVAEVSQDGAHIDSSTVVAIAWQDWTFVRNAFEKIRIPASQVNRGELLFIFGESGIGKSTFASNLLAINFDSDLQIISAANPILLTRANRESYQKLLGWIPQSPQLASGSVRDQFLILDRKLADLEIVSALEQAGLSVNELPQGLDTQLGKGGEQSHSASGGQVRRIAVARALIRKPSIVIADEPTADLDHESAQAVMNSLRKAQAAGGIVICITHDYSLIAENDRVIEVVRGTP